MCGKEPLIEVAIALERAALADEYFITRKLYPNVDFYSGLIYKGTALPGATHLVALAMGFPIDFFPVLFAVPRLAGWLAHWKEAMEEESPKIWRPRQIYVGHPTRSYVPLDQRPSAAASGSTLKMESHPFNRRHVVSVLKSKL